MLKNRRRDQPRRRISGNSFEKAFRVRTWIAPGSPCRLDQLRHFVADKPDQRRSSAVRIRLQLPINATGSKPPAFRSKMIREAASRLLSADPAPR